MLLKVTHAIPDSRLYAIIIDKPGGQSLFEIQVDFKGFPCSALPQPTFSHLLSRERSQIAIISAYHFSGSLKRILEAVKRQETVCSGGLNTRFDPAEYTVLIFIPCAFLRWIEGMRFVEPIECFFRLSQAKESLAFEKKELVLVNAKVVAFEESGFKVHIEECQCILSTPILLFCVSAVHVC